MPIITDVRKQRTELRLQLLANGYTPLPNNRKICYLEGWSTVDVTPEVIESREWARKGSWSDTGIRCGDIVAFDFDIDEADILNDLLDVLVGEGLLPETPLVRVGRPPREIWVYRVEGPTTAKRTTGGFGFADEQVEVKKRIAAGEGPGKFRKLVVEVLGVGAQIGAFGQHSDDHDYNWPLQSPIDTPVEDLPAVTREMIEAVVTRSAEFFNALGLEQIDLGGGTNDGHYTRVYDLTDDMVFPTRELGDLTVPQLKDYFDAHPGAMLRCTVAALRPSTGGSMAGMVNLVQGLLCVSDHGSYTSHFPVDANPADKLARMGDKLMSLFGDRHAKPEPVKHHEARSTEPGEDLAMTPHDDFDTNLDTALRRYAYITSDDTIVDTFINAGHMSVQHFRNLMMPFFYTEETKQGGEKICRLSDAWMQNPDRVNVAAAQMRPDQAWPFYEMDGQLFANTYRPQELPAEGGDATIGLNFLRTLVPNPDEHAYVMQWLSYKLQNPHVRGPSIVMVANATFGTGRGSLGSLLEDLLGERYVNHVDFTTLTGKSYQAQYNEWLMDSLMVVVNEAADSDRNASKWEAKNQAYEHLKNIVDPANTRNQINRKGKSNYQGRTFASVMIMTNHADALVIPAGDRRFYIVENGSNSSPEYWDAFHAWRSDPANVGALFRALCAVDLTGYNPFQAPPMTRAKAEMIYAGMSDLDRAMAAVLDALPGRLVVREQVFVQVDRYAHDNAMNLPDEWRNRSGEKIFNSLTRAAYGVVDRIRMDDGKQYAPRALPGLDPNVLLSKESMLEEILKNGPTVRTLGNATGVVLPFRGKGQTDDTERTDVGATGT